MNSQTALGWSPTAASKAEECVTQEIPQGQRVIVLWGAFLGDGWADTDGMLPCVVHVKKGNQQEGFEQCDSKAGKLRAREPIPLGSEPPKRVLLIRNWETVHTISRGTGSTPFSPPVRARYCCAALTEGVVRHRSFRCVASSVLSTSPTKTLISKVTSPHGLDIYL